MDLHTSCLRTGSAELSGALQAITKISSSSVGHWLRDVGVLSLDANARENHKDYVPTRKIDDRSHGEKDQVGDRAHKERNELGDHASQREERKYNAQNREMGDPKDA